MSAPLVSVMIPCHDAAQTLPIAFASLRAQRYPNWEAVVVDDGSTDETWRVIEAWRDPRFRVERFEVNRGRGAARQRCLEMATGEFLSFLDADDWLFDGKLEHQVDLMGSHPGATVVSGACVITDAEGCAVGLTQTGLVPGEDPTLGTFRRIGAPPLSFPPCMIRMEAARKARFNPDFRRSQDSDFLIQVMFGQKYAVSSVPVYAYSQAEAANLDKTLEGYRYRMRSYARYQRRFPLQSSMEIGKTLAKMAIYRAAGALHAEDRLIARRWDPITPAARRAYDDARAAMQDELAKGPR